MIPETDKTYGLTRQNLLDGNFTTPSGAPVKHITICELGRKRSVDAARIANETYGVPVLFLIGGLDGILRHTNYLDKPQYLEKLRSAPSPVVILQPFEMVQFASILTKMKNYNLFYDTPEFLSHLANQARI